MSKRGIIVVCFLAVVASAAARKHVIQSRIKTWRMPNPTAVADTTTLDSAFLNLPMREPLTDYSVSSATNGQLVSAAQSRVYFDRTKHVDDPFGMVFDAFTITPQTLRYYNTTMPFSRIGYKKGFTSYHEENDLSVLLTGNLNRRLNVGFEMNYLTAVGHFANQAGKTYNGSVWGSYNGNHYSTHIAFMWNRLSSFDNGGIQDINELAGRLNSEDIPVRLNAMAGYRYLAGYMNHSYSITVDREYHDSVEVEIDGHMTKRDTVKVEYTPVVTFNYTFETNNSNRRYIEKTAQQNFYDTCFLNSSSTRDSSDVLTIKNTFAVTFEEAFNRKLKFGATVYAYNECQRHLLLNTDTFPQQDSIFRYRWTNNTFVGGALYKNQGKWVHYGFDGDVCVLGYKIGEFRVGGHLNSDFRLGKDTMYLSAMAEVKNETPSYYHQHYYSNHLWWDNDFGKTYRIHAQAKAAYPTQWIKPALQFDFENLSRGIYYINGAPQQHDGHTQLIAARARIDLTTPWINLENTVVYQHSTNATVVSVPAVTLYHNLYYHGSWFRHAMDAQIGVDFRYFSSYYAPVFNPASGQFSSQNETMVGNYPVLNVYANFWVRLLRLRFFAHYQHFNYHFMTKNTNRLTMPGYPMNTAVFRAGIVWQFYR